jgi:hypothetical protein
MTRALANCQALLKLPVPLCSIENKSLPKQANFVARLRTNPTPLRALRHT